MVNKTRLTVKNAPLFGLLQHDIAYIQRSLLQGHQFPDSPNSHAGQRDNMPAAGGAGGGGLEVVVVVRFGVAKLPPNLIAVTSTSPVNLCSRASIATYSYLMNISSSHTQFVPKMAC